MSSYPELKGKVAVITGAAGNLGAAVAARFAAEKMRLVLVDRNQERLDALVAGLKLPKVATMTAQTDITNREAVEKLASAVVRRFKHVEILVNVAGGFAAGDPIHALDEKTFTFMMDLNARSVFLMSGAFVRVMIEKGTAGRVVTIASRSGLKGEANMAAYSASKAVALRLTESLAAETLHKGITVNAVLPSVIDTPQNRAGGAPAEEVEKWVKPASLAEVVTFLVSDGARDISGAAIPVYGRA